MRSPRRVATGGTYTRDQAPKRVLTHYKIVACPECKAPVGADCMTRAGKVKTKGCTPRVRMAAREVVRRAESL